jgi:hypothetical protein
MEFEAPILRFNRYRVNELGCEESFSPIPLA